jgi:hypothetical protein
MDIKNIGSEAVDRIFLRLDRSQRGALVNTIMIIRVLSNLNFFTGLATISFRRWTELLGVT